MPFIWDHSQRIALPVQVNYSVSLPFVRQPRGILTADSNMWYIVQSVKLKDVGAILKSMEWPKPPSCFLTPLLSRLKQERKIDKDLSSLFFFLLEKWSKTLLFFNALLLSAFVLRCCVKFIKLLLQSMWLPSDVYDHLPNHLYSEDWNNTNEPVLCDLPKNVSVALFKSVSRF